MLDFNLLATAPDRLWDAATVVATVPEAETTASSARLTQSEDPRKHRRIPLEGRAILVHENQIIGVYTCNLSAAGVGFFCPFQLFPATETQLIIDGIDLMKITVETCRRLSKNCYKCGAIFSERSKSPGELRDIFSRLRKSTDEGDK